MKHWVALVALLSVALVAPVPAQSGQASSLVRRRKRVCTGCGPAGELTSEPEARQAAALSRRPCRTGRR